MRYLLAILALLLTLPARAQRLDTPLAEPPAGFHWQPLPEARAALLLPDGWYFRPEVQKNNLTYYLTQDQMGESGQYQAGLSLHVVRRAKKYTRLPAPAYAERLMLRAGFGQGQRQQEQGHRTEGPLALRWVRYREALPDAEPRMVYQLAMANGKTDTLYLLVFEGPEKEWAELWPLGQTMVRELTLDSKL
ncbi:hypothetical protein Q5H93_18900 [Hymenobacter sp. ASUV-10]|uniref:DUF1795 domain-containing protein n=1 Tax=Hymenobacter aranciens TaxID=3063996 RepID=A0ABT9BJJ7_9BACT|nr:hypothetical protein [Hymenobacter sp. ASUV-10]MDO7876821.1 hypothetical protein [Hymenobacter sp. ASUV-10]